MIRIATPADAEKICSIYNTYIENSIISFEEEPISVSQMQTRIKEIGATFPWLVFIKNDEILGYAYASTWKARSAYRHSIESTIYLTKQATGQGIGNTLYTALITELQTTDAHCLIGCIALPNIASVALHEKVGFKKVAHFKAVGKKFEQWIDVGFWQLML
jgi:phosphinothricin acetyltransferase